MVSSGAQPDFLRQLEKGTPSDWRVSSVTSGAAALDEVDSGRVDVVVTEMDLEDMTGERLLEQLRERRREVIRLALVSEDDRNRVMKSFGLAHHFLLKRTAAEKLAAVVGNICDAVKVFECDSLAALIPEITNIPSFPALYFALIDELGRKEASTKNIARIISKDPSMTASIMRITNSPFFGLMRRITDPAEAVAYLGVDSIKTLALTTHVFSHYRHSSVSGFRIETLWGHSLAVSVCVREIVRAETENKEARNNAFMAGMLHDIGVLLLAANFPEEYGEILKTARTSKLAIHEAEDEIFKATHSQVGGLLLCSWGLPHDVVEPILFHHNPHVLKARERNLTLAALCAANYFVARHQAYAESAYVIAEMDGDYLLASGFGDRIDAWRDICAEVLERD